jgi:DNA-binding transcriptional MerR regulator
LPRTYKLKELEALSGFDKRTIAYYVQESLLPKVGRRGPRTRYSQEFLDRLMLIRRVRDLQDAGKLRAVTLSEIRDVIDRESAEEIRTTSLKRASAERLRSMFAEPDLDTSEYGVRAEDVAVTEVDEAAMADAGIEGVRGADDSTGMTRSSRRRSLASQVRGLRPGKVGSAQDDEDRLGRLLKEVERRARRGAKGSAGQSSERVIRVAVTENIVLSVRNVGEEDGGVVERLAEILRRVARLAK